MAKVDPNEGGKKFPKLQQADLGDADVAVLTISGYAQRNMPSGDMVKELVFAETDKPLRLNRTQIKYLIEALDSDDSDDWTGQPCPVEKKTVEGPTGELHDVVWVSPPEQWAQYLRDAGIAKLPNGVRERKVATAAAANAATPKRGRPPMRKVKRSRGK